MIKEKYSYYEYSLERIYTELQKQMDTDGYGWIYKIYGEGCPPYYDGIIESDEWYDCLGDARLAAIGHITKLENGEG